MIIQRLEKQKAKFYSRKFLFRSLLVFNGEARMIDYLLVPIEPLVKNRLVVLSFELKSSNYLTAAIPVRRGFKYIHALFSKSIWSYENVLILLKWRRK